jgi:hypothetical protein
MTVEGEEAVRQALAEHDRTIRLETLDMLEEMLRQRDDVAWADDDVTFQEIDRFRAALADLEIRDMTFWAR